MPAGLALALRALAPVDLAESALPWLPSAFIAALAAIATLAALAALVPALRTGSLSSLLEAGSSAALAGGAVVMLAGAGSLDAPVLGAAILLSAASFVGTRRISGGPSRLIGAAVGGHGRGRGGRAADRHPGHGDSCCRRSRRSCSGRPPCSGRWHRSGPAACDR